MKGLSQRVACVWLTNFAGCRFEIKKWFKVHMSRWLKVDCFFLVGLVRDRTADVQQRRVLLATPRSFRESEWPVFWMQTDTVTWGGEGAPPDKRPDQRQWWKRSPDTSPLTKQVRGRGGKGKSERRQRRKGKVLRTVCWLTTGSRTS